MIDFMFINNPETLVELRKELLDEEEVAIDLECENNLHHYGTYLALIQLSTEKKNWVVDVLALKDIDPLKELFADAKIRKIFHDINFDLRILQHQFGCKFKNIYDTQLAALFLGEENVGLGSLLEKYFQINKEKKFQRVDWTKRPLSLAMLEYAAKDTAYLIELRKKLEQKLDKAGRIEWVRQECEAIEKIEWSFHEQIYSDLSGAKSMTPRERGILHALFDQRDKYAKQFDKPAFMIMRNKQLLAFSKNPPSLADWKRLRNVHPIVKRDAEKLYRLAKSAQPEDPERLEKKRLKPDQYEFTKVITSIRNEVAEKLDIKAHLLLSNDQIWNIAKSNSLDGVRDWQKKLFKDRLHFNK